MEYIMLVAGMVITVLAFVWYTYKPKIEVVNTGITKKGVLLWYNDLSAYRLNRRCKLLFEYKV